MVNALKPAIQRIDGVNFHDLMRLIDMFFTAEQLICLESGYDEYLQ